MRIFSTPVPLKYSPLSNDCAHNNSLHIRPVLRIFAEPVQAHYLSLKGFEQLIRTISNVKKKINPGLEIAGILITMADMRTNYSRDIVELLRSAYGESVRIFDSIIPLSIRAAETSAEGKSIYDTCGVNFANARDRD